jgi:hypothetical protein
MCLWIGNIGCDSFFLECCTCINVEAREQLTNNLHFLDSLIIKTLLFGDDPRKNIHNYSNQYSCTSNKRNVLQHSDHTSYIEVSHFLLC